MDFKEDFKGDLSPFSGWVTNYDVESKNYKISGTFSGTYTNSAKAEEDLRHKISKNIDADIIKFQKDIDFSKRQIAYHKKQLEELRQKKEEALYISNTYKAENANSI